MMSFRGVRAGRIAAAVVVIGCVLGVARAQCERGWKGPLAPTVTRQYHAMVYDEARQKVVLFGGWNATTSASYNGDTWTWDGASWARVSTTGPGPRGQLGMAYDRVRERVVLFGGRTYSGPGTIGLNDTWEWDGAAWTQVAAGGPTAPPSPPFPVMVYDAARARTMLYDGELGWLWAWDGAAWTRVNETGPSRRNGFNMAYDPNDDRIILFGGFMRDLESGQNDTWAWDGSSWTQVATTGPAPRYEHAMAYDAGLGRVVIHGGINDPSVDPVYGDTWSWDGQAWSPLAVPDIAGRFDTAMAYDQAREQMVMVGGGTWRSGGPGPMLGETRVLTPTSWSVAQEAMDPPARYNFAAAYDSGRDRVVVFGGRNADGEAIADTREWDGERWIDVNPATEPNPGEYYCMAYDAARGVTIMVDGDGSYTWIWDGVNWTRRTTPGGPGHALARMAYDQHRQRVVLFGGRVAGVLYPTDTWEWDGAAWAQIPTAVSPPGRWLHTMAYNPATQRVVMYGSNTTTPMLRDTWEWDGAAWTKVGDSGPGVTYMAMAFDPSSNAMVLYGGSIGISFYSHDSYRWSGTGWVEQSYAPEPNGRSQHQMVTDTRRGRALVIGGRSLFGSTYSDIWEHSTPETPAVITQPQGTQADPGGTAVFKVEASGHQLMYRWRRDGQPIFDGGAIRGAERSDLRIDPVSAADAGSYDCIVSNGCGTVISGAARLITGCSADLNGDGVVDFADYLEFLNLFEAQDPLVDFNGDGVVDFADYLEFLNQFDAGC